MPAFFLLNTESNENKLNPIANSKSDLHYSHTLTTAPAAH
ncbi:MAG: hypothetical protein ACFWUD_05825 [Thermocaproicibacter melissae]|jgi:hypothetical protein